MLSRCDMMFGDAVEFDWLSQHPQPPFTATDSSFQMQMDEYSEWFDELHENYPRVKNWMMGMRNEVSSNHHTLTGNRTALDRRRATSSAHYGYS